MASVGWRQRCEIQCESKNKNKEVESWEAQPRVRVFLQVKEVRLYCEGLRVSNKSSELGGTQNKLGLTHKVSVKILASSQEGTLLWWHL